MIARMIAAGVPERDICRSCGTTFQRLDHLKCSPAFQELITSYRQVAEPAAKAAMDTYVELATKNMIMAQRMIADALEQAEIDGDVVKIRDLLAIAADGADRFGYSKHTVSLHGNAADFVGRLERANVRSMRVIEGSKVVECAPTHNTAEAQGEVPQPPPVELAPSAVDPTDGVGPGSLLHEIPAPFNPFAGRL
jgi:hypothetical protein